MKEKATITIKIRKSTWERLTKRKTEKKPFVSMVELVDELSKLKR